MQIISTIRNTFQFEPTTIDNFANWKIYRSDKYRFELKYPDTWNIANPGSELDEESIGFITYPRVGVFSISLMENVDNLSLLELARHNITANNCPSFDDQPGDHMIRSDSSGAMYVLYCSLMSESYIYLFKNATGDIIELNYSDDFEADWSEDKKLTVFDKIISTIRLTP